LCGRRPGHQRRARDSQPASPHRPLRRIEAHAAVRHSPAAFGPEPNRNLANRGTEGSNPSPSSSESANPRSRSVVVLRPKCHLHRLRATLRRDGLGRPPISFTSTLFSEKTQTRSGGRSGLAEQTSVRPRRPRTNRPSSALSGAPTHFQIKRLGSGFLRRKVASEATVPAPGIWVLRPRRGRCRRDLGPSPWDPRRSAIHTRSSHSTLWVKLRGTCAVGNRPLIAQSTGGAHSRDFVPWRFPDAGLRSV
jgi:hypothetical protein